MVKKYVNSLSHYPYLSQIILNIHLVITCGQAYEKSDYNYVCIRICDNFVIFYAFSFQKMYEEQNKIVVLFY